MSAWRVSHNHIRVLVEACFKYEVVTPPVTEGELGRILWRENYRSVNYRYSERARTPKYVHDSSARCVDHQKKMLGTVREIVRQPHTVFKLLCCYDYQTCECPDWEASKAYRIIQALSAGVLRSLGMDANQASRAPEWDAEPWGID